MVLADRVRVSRRFQRSIRIDSDLCDPATLEGFICPRSSAVVLETMSEHVAKSGQGAFTWTGPYGSGKSSLVIALSAVLSGDAEVRRFASDLLGPHTSGLIWNALPTKDRGWRVLPVVGRRDQPAQVVGEAIERTKLVRRGHFGAWSDQEVFATLTRVAKRNAGETGGVIVFIDEMGKFLEGAAYDGTDIYFFQQLAELASRSNGRLIVVGILHQAFQEYGHRLSREMRDEWAKIQGRFVDLAVNASPDEQLELIGRAIQSDYKPEGHPNGLVEKVANLSRQSTDPGSLAACWPLHPIVAMLLGPISRRRFGQNQRSIFGFLNSTEPQGFQDFLRGAHHSDNYAPETLWDYLRFNLEPSIMASPDGHRWAVAVDALDRCESAFGDELASRLLRTIGLLDLFKERSGLVASLELLNLALRGRTSTEINETVAELEDRSLIIYRKFSDSYSVFEGSDFDIEQAIDEAYGTIGELDFARLTELAGLQPVIAKRHYHETGALRWCDTAVVPLSDVEEAAAEYAPSHGSIGTFFLALPTHGDPPESVEIIARRVAAKSNDRDVVVGVPERAAWTITTLARDLMALEHVRDATPELQGDRVARLEVQSRIADLQGHIETELSRALDDALWFTSNGRCETLDQADLSRLASDMADSRYPQTPRLHNELLNRIKPSSNAVAARNVLLRSMALDEGEPRLGIRGYPPEGGLFDSLLQATGLYRETADGWRFVGPTPEHGDPNNLQPAWEAAKAILENSSHTAISLDELFDLWRRPPFGIRDGLLPVLAVAFMLSHRRELALYREGTFQPRLTDLDVDYLSNDPSDIQLRWMELSDTSRQLLSEMADIVRDMDSEDTLTLEEPIDVARGLVSIYDRVPPWVGRTQRLSQTAKRVRQLFKQASDPNRFIFDDIPQLLNGAEELPQRVFEVSEIVEEGLSELSAAFPTMLLRLRETLLAELGVPNTSDAMLAELRARAENIRQLSGDHRLEAFILRISRFEGSDADMETLASMAASKPPRHWVDADVDRATVELADLARQFVRHEAYAHVKGRTDNRLAMAVVVGLDGRPIHDEFEVTDREQIQVDELIERVRLALSDSGEAGQNVILAALARVTAQYLESREEWEGSGVEEAVS